MAGHGGDPIGGELVFDESVEAQILIEGANHIIAIRIGKRADPVVAEHQHAVLGVGISRDVEPVSSPAFTVLW